MNLDLLKSKLDTIQNRNTGEKKDYTTIFWKPTVGKQQIRLVPSMYTPDNPFSELKFYYGITNKVMISPLNIGGKDPIAEFVQKLYDSNDKSNFDLARKLRAKNRIFAPVVVRGEEDKGVRLWGFGQQIYTELLAMATDEEIGDFTDVTGGLDFTAETVGPEATGTQYNKTSIRAKRQNTPLSEDATQVETWLNTQPNPTEQFKKYTFDEMKDALRRYLEPESDNQSEGAISSEAPTPFEMTSNTNTESKGDLPWEKGNSGYTADTSKAKVAKTDKFDSLFED